MFKNKELSNIIPVSIQDPEQVMEEFAISVEDDYILTTGEHYGRIACYREFSSKNGVKYGKFTFGTAKRYGEKSIVHEAERVFFADYHADSELIKLFNSLGCMEGKKVFPERVLNKAIRFTVAENPETASAYKFIISEIIPIEEIPADMDFKYIKTFNGIGYDYTAVTLDAKEETNAKPKAEYSSRKSFKQILQSVEDDVNFE